MPSHGWTEIDHAHLLQKIILLQLLNKNQEKPSEKTLPELRLREDSSSVRAFSLQREKQLAESFAFLAATTDDPKKIVAVCVEEDEEKRSLTVRLAINNGNLDDVKPGFERMSKILQRVMQIEQSRIEEEQHALLREAVALNQNRILLRLRSRHATYRCNFKKEKMQRPKIIPQLYDAVNGSILDRIAGVAPPVLIALRAEVQILQRLFANLEDLSTPKAKSSPGLEILVQLVKQCQHLHDRHILHQALIGPSRLAPDSRASITRTITKLGRYSAVSQFLIQAARKYFVFKNLRISTVHFRAPNLPATEFDSTTTDFVDSLLNRPRFGKFASKSHLSSSSAIMDHIRQEATLAVPVHAEIQLLFHHEWNPCNLPPRIICSSKQACFLCDLFFKIHGKFTVPSTHGRLYEKWALPHGFENLENAGGGIFTICWTFVSAIENALLREIRLARKPFPDPYESMILHSAACSQSNSSRISARNSSASQKPGWCEGPIPAPNNDTISPTCSQMAHTEKATSATAAAAENRNDVYRSRSETSSAATMVAPSASNALPEHIDGYETTSPCISCVSLAKDQPVWCEISATASSFEVRTPRIHLTVLQDEILSNLRSRRLSHDLVAGWDRYWVILEYLSDRSIQQGHTVPLVDLLDISSGRDMTLDYGNSEWPRELHVYCKDDIISIMYSSQKPVSGLEYRT